MLLYIQFSIQFQMFGNIIGDNVCFAMDCSDLNFSGRREFILKEHLQVIQYVQPCLAYN